LSHPLYATHEPLIRLTINVAQMLKWEAHPLIVGIFLAEPEAAKRTMARRRIALLLVIGTLILGTTAL
jgi:hypothetical protein